MILLKPLKHRFLAILMQVDLNITIWTGGVYMIWVMFDRDATRYFETYVVFAITGLCLFFFTALFVRCPECNKSMQHLYKPGDGLLMHRGLMPHEIFTQKLIECPACNQVVKFRD
ncbi:MULTISPECIES: hypothetical protein [Pseudomonas]|uniref:Uncharacterized protein n=1 Tax=Pseudomonas fluorescens TaxID=294 RepID=A0A5E6VN23_PSEFL|nr:MULTISPECIES: hypothetical protein [Pseudomonas]VVN19093.1 hypothetical protein PS652_04228 [Pseudomonas fluorescens]